MDKNLFDTTDLENSIKSICFGKIDWFKVFRDAYESRKGAWKDLGHIQEWRNATDEVLFAFYHQFEKELKVSLEQERQRLKIAVEKILDDVCKECQYGCLRLLKKRLFG